MYAYVPTIFLSAKQDMTYKILFIYLFIFSLQAAVVIHQDCVPCTVRPGCSECLVYSGGPFNNQNNSNISYCVDNLGGCKYRNYTNTIFQFNCGGCLVEGWCTYTVSGYFLNATQIYTGCTNSTDVIWLKIKDYLDALYRPLYGLRAHSWCERVCETLTAAQQSLIIIATVAGLSILFAALSHFFCRTKADRAIL